MWGLSSLAKPYLFWALTSKQKGGTRGAQGPNNQNRATENRNSITKTRVLPPLLVHLIRASVGLSLSHSQNEATNEWGLWLVDSIFFVQGMYETWNSSLKN